MVKGRTIIQKTLKKLEKRKKDHVSLASAVPNVSPDACIAFPLLVPRISSKLQPKPFSRSTTVSRESGPPERLKSTVEITANQKLVERELKGGSATSKAKNREVAMDDLNPYVIEGAIDGLLEVGGIEGSQSPKKQKKLANTATEGEAVAMLAEEGPRKVKSKAKKILYRVTNAQRKKLPIFNIQGTLLNCSLLLNKNLNIAISPMFRIKKS
jgi:hypothetical protein